MRCVPPKRRAPSEIHGATTNNTAFLILRKQIGRNGVRVLITVAMKITILWDVMPCSLVNHYRRLGGMCCPHLQGSLKMVAELSSETSLTTYQATRRHYLDIS
jgi:hypothetical protein